MSDSSNESISFKCCFCGWECDPNSQACGPCMRLTSSMNPKDIVYYHDLDEPMDTPDDKPTLIENDDIMEDDVTPDSSK